MHAVRTAPLQLVDDLHPGQQAIFLGLELGNLFYQCIESRNLLLDAGITFILIVDAMLQVGADPECHEAAESHRGNSRDAEVRLTPFALLLAPRQKINTRHVSRNSSGPVRRL